MKVNIQPLPGYILTKPYVKKDQVFKAAKEADGIDQTSEVLVVGDPVLDNHNTMRSTMVVKGNIIHHAYSSKEIEIDFTKYRYVHFNEIHGIVKE